MGEVTAVDVFGVIRLTLNPRYNGKKCVNRIQLVFGLVTFNKDVDAIRIITIL